MFSLDIDDFQFTDDGEDENCLANFDLDDVSNRKSEATPKSRRSFQLDSSSSPVNQCMLSSFVTEPVNTANVNGVCQRIPNTLRENCGSKPTVIVHEEDSIYPTIVDNECSSSLALHVPCGQQSTVPPSCHFDGTLSELPAFDDHNVCDKARVATDSHIAGSKDMVVLSRESAISTEVNNMTAAPNAMFETSLDDSDLEFVLDTSDVAWMPAVVTECPKSVTTKGHLIQNSSHEKLSIPAANVMSVFKKHSHMSITPRVHHVEKPCAQIARKRFTNSFSITESHTPQAQSFCTPRKPNNMTNIRPATSTLCEQYDTPTTRRVSAVNCRTTISSVSTSTPSTGRRRRKFPGPAGVLPELKDGETFQDAKKLKPDSLDTSPVEQVVVSREEMTSSQRCNDQFQSGPWQMMKDELEAEAATLLECFNLSNITRKASKKQLPKGKVPVTCVMIDSVNLQTPDASVVLRDPTATMNGTIHRQLLKEYPLQLQAGSVLVLRQVGVFSPSARNHYLNITPNNIVRIYTVKCGTQSSSGSSQRLSEFVSSDFHCERLVSDTSSPVTPIACHQFSNVLGGSNCHQSVNSSTMTDPITAHRQYNLDTRLQHTPATTIHRDNVLRKGRLETNSIASSFTNHGVELNVCVNTTSNITSQQYFYKDELNDLMSGIEDEMMTDF